MRAVWGVWRQSSGMARSVSGDRSGDRMGARAVAMMEERRAN